MRACVRVCVRVCVCVCVRACVRARLPAFMHVCVKSFQQLVVYTHLNTTVIVLVSFVPRFTTVKEIIEICRL